MGRDKSGAVMVVGGGICGMQAALDLANSGFKVYLVEEASSIGGRMAQLDKTFPTNDCSMCMISPKLVEVDKHPNVEILAPAELLELRGEPGNFRARVLLHPRYVDPTKCNACGDCVERCPVELPAEFEFGLALRKAIHKRYPQAIPSAMLISKRGDPPCRLECPAGCNAQGYVALIAQGKYLEALRHVKQWVPLPGVQGRICHHPCELKCNRREVDEAVAIRPLKRFVADWVRQRRRAGQLPPEERPSIDPNRPRVAVVGSGPAGLTCAYYLAQMGYPVTILEANDRPGGMLQTAIPPYRLPKDVLADEIQQILDLGVELRTGVTVGRDVSLEELRREYGAVFIAVGAQRSVPLGVPGEELPGVWPALEFLKRINRGEWPQLGRTVAVIGGGNVAIDAARSARRLGAEVTIVYRRTRAEMPANPEEIEGAEQEGVRFLFLAAPQRVLGRERVEALECIRMELGEPDASGRRRPVPIPGSEFTLQVDAVIVAIGQAIDLSLLPPQWGLQPGRGNTIPVDPLTLATPVEGVFAGGDAVSGPATAVEAIRHGHEAAISIDRYLRGVDLREGREGPRRTPVPAPEGQWKREPRRPMPTLPIERRLKGFEEVELGYTEEEARREARRCLNCGLCSECMQCVEACRAEAIRHDQVPQERELEVGAVILAPGFEPFDPRPLGWYGYGRFRNVVTSLEFERILSASGPYQGKVLRPSDGQPPRRIAWIQCVGSRNVRMEKDYCSAVCCMYATKEAIIAREHDERIEPTIFYNDLRAFGKGFERYWLSARDKFGVRFVRGIVASVREDPSTQNLTLEYLADGGRRVSEEFDLVVLSVGLVPSASTRRLAERLGIELNPFGFCRTGEFSPNRTSRPGVYVAGAFAAPKDIPESVMDGSAAACLASCLIAEARGSEVARVEYPPEIDVRGQEPRIGVFVCHCGTNIARVVNVPEVVEYARGLPHVVHAEDNLYTCSTDTQQRIIQAIKEHGLNRVVVASCSPRTHEPLFQDTIRRAGLNKYLFEMANIRDQCSWVHGSDPEAATRKAKDLVRMAVARAATLEPLREMPMEVVRRGLVIGGGLAGITAALSLADQGFEAHLVERGRELGGNLRRLRGTLEDGDPQRLLQQLLERLESHPRVTVHRETEVVEFAGHVGNFRSTLRRADGSTQVVEHGITIVATGAVEYKPREYLYGEHPGVVTQLELEERLAEDPSCARAWGTVVMIQCVGSREPDHQYCSRVCCAQAIKNALRLKQLNPELQVYVLYRDVRAYGFQEVHYRRAREQGVVFVRYEEDRKPEVSAEGEGLLVRVVDVALGREVVLRPDLVVLSAGMRPQEDAPELATRLRLPLTEDGFFMEAHMKLRPLDFSMEGMYLCGLAHGPKGVAESIAQATGAVSRALTVLSQPHLLVGGVVSVVDQERCAACLTCVRACPYQVPRINEQGVAEIEPAACQGCGICASACPRRAIQLQHYKDEQVLAKCVALCA